MDREDKNLLDKVEKYLLVEVLTMKTSVTLL